MAWLHTTHKGMAWTRAEGQKEDSYYLTLDDPPMNYLLMLLFEMGAAMPSFNGATSLTSVEIKAFCEMSDTTLEPWEFRAIKKMSHIYADGLKKYHLSEHSAPEGISD